MNIVLIIVGLLVLLMFVGMLYEILATLWTKQRFKTPPGKLVDVGGHQLHIQVMGERSTGQPTVVLESGASSNSLDWQRVQPNIAEFTQVVSYDRAGFGWSDKGTDPRTPDRLAEELHTLLKNAEIKPPYIMVGHSFGGIYVRLFAETYPDDVVGLVLIEASVPSMLKTINTEPEFRRLKNVDRMRRIGLVRLMLPRVLHHVKYLSPTARKKYFAINMLDGMNVMREAREVYKGVELADKVEVPLTVISREVFEEASEEMRWQDYQQELVRLSSTSKHIHTNNINHYPMLAEPELVTDAIREMFDKVTK